MIEKLFYAMLYAAFLALELYGKFQFLLPPAM